MEKKVQIQKRDGVLESYSPEKIKRVLLAAGCTQDQANRLIKIIDAWFIEIKKEIVTSLEVRDKLLAELPSVNETAANLYRWYESTKADSQV